MIFVYSSIVLIVLSKLDTIYTIFLGWSPLLHCIRSLKKKTLGVEICCARSKTYDIFPIGWCDHSHLTPVWFKHDQLWEPKRCESNYDTL